MCARVVIILPPGPLPTPASPPPPDAAAAPQVGTNSYVEPIAEAGKRLDELNEQRASQLQRLKVTEKERMGLDGAKAEAEDFLTKARR